MMTNLFRIEVVEARQNRWLGGVALTQPLSMRIFTVGSVVVAAAIIAFLSTATYTRRTRVLGELAPVQGLSTVFTSEAGVVEKLLVSEGDHVRAKQPVAVIRIPRTMEEKGNAETALEAALARRRASLDQSKVAQAGQLDAQEKGIRAQLETARRELSQLTASQATHNKQIQIAQEVLDRFNQLKASKYVSILQIKQQESTLLSYRSELEELQRQATISRRLIAQLEQSLAEIPSQQSGVAADYSKSLASLEQEEVQLQADGTVVVTSPVSGVVATELTKPGQWVATGKPLLSIVPGQGLLEAELMVPSEAIGLIAPNNVVLLRYSAFPYQKFGHFSGHVVRISHSPLVNDGSEEGKNAEPRYRVTVAIDQQSATAFGRTEQLLPGMTLEADIYGERRKLLEWLFEPLYALSRTTSHGNLDH